MAGGRPTKFLPEMCETVVRLGKDGASKHEMALELGIVMSTFDVWQNDNQLFSEAVKEAISFSQGKWEKHGRLASFGLAQTNATTYMFNMKNRFLGWDDITRRENQNLDADGKPTDASLTVEFVGVKK